MCDNYVVCESIEVLLNGLIYSIDVMKDLKDYLVQKHETQEVVCDHCRQTSFALHFGCDHFYHESDEHMSDEDIQCCDGKIRDYKHKCEDKEEDNEEDIEDKQRPKHKEVLAEVVDKDIQMEDNTTVYQPIGDTLNNNQFDNNFDEKIIEWESRPSFKFKKMAKLDSNKRIGVFRRDIKEIINDSDLNINTIESRKQEIQRIDRLIGRLENSGLIDDSMITDIDIESEDQNCIQHKNDLINCRDSEGRVLINIGHNECEPDIYLAETIADKVMAHQIGGIRFLFDNVIESVDALDSSEGFGCILTHAMGLGKTLEAIALVDIFMRLKTKNTVMIVLPVNVLNNWIQEFNKWLPPKKRSFGVYSIDKLNQKSRDNTIQKWHNSGGVLLICYERYLSITSKFDETMDKKRKLSRDDVKRLQTALENPGPHLVICDEGHRIKNDESGISQALKMIKTRRRVILTGYPLQNKLKEYYCMIDFVRPNYLGLKWEFNNTFDTPITNGQCKDSTDSDKQLMRERSHVLNQLLKGFIQRRNEDVLQSLLPQKQEFVIYCKLSSKQRELLYEFLKILVNNNPQNSEKISLFKTFVVCSKICNHPDIIHDIIQRGNDKEEIDPEDDPQPNAYFWAENLFTNYQKEVLSNSNKMVILFDIIEETVAKGERLLIFSQWLFTLDLIERLLQTRNVFHSDNKWKKFSNYYRLDGQTKPEEREQLINNFNSKNNKTVHLFLISTKAGGIGINLTGANRIVIFDACWNPCHDAQASCRIFRPGQSKTCFIYRLISDKSMEKRIFNKQIFKQGMSKGVVDQQNIDLKLNQNEVRVLLIELLELLQIEDSSDLDEQKLIEIRDPLLSTVCQKCESCLTSVPIEFQTLLEEMKELALTSAQKKEAFISFKASQQMDLNLEPISEPNIDLLDNKLKNIEL